MINVIREIEVPASLNRIEIQEYLSALALHLEDSDNYPEPLKRADYRNWDVLASFDRCFHSKCYITEKKDYNSWRFDIDHFIPQNERKDLVHEWTNLFPCDHWTNLIKTRKTPAGGYLDPTKEEDDVEVMIIYNIDFQFENFFFDPADSSNIKAKNTCSLLDRVHNGHDDWSKRTTANLRGEIQYRANEILKELKFWRKAEEGSSQKIEHEATLRSFLSRKSSFTMLMRSMPIVQKNCADLFD